MLGLNIASDLTWNSHVLDVIKKASKRIYYSTMMSFYHIWSRERAKYETVIHCSVPV